MIVHMGIIWAICVVVMATTARRGFYSDLEKSIARLKNVEYSIKLYKNKYSFPDMDSSLYSDYIGVPLPPVNKMQPLINNIGHILLACLQLLIMLGLSATFWFDIFPMR